MFYYNETRNHIKWLITKSPTTKTPDGEVVNLQGIFDGLDTSSLLTLKKSIDDKYRDEFISAYKLMLDGCYSCHKSAGRPYLHLVIPTVPPQSIIVTPGGELRTNAGRSRTVRQPGVSDCGGAL